MASYNRTQRIAEEIRKVIIKKQKLNLKTFMHTNVHCSTLYNSEDMETI